MIIKIPLKDMLEEVSGRKLTVTEGNISIFPLQRAEKCWKW